MSVVSSLLGGCLRWDRIVEDLESKEEANGIDDSLGFKKANTGNQIHISMTPLLFSAGFHLLFQNFSKYA